VTDRRGRFTIELLRKTYGERSQGREKKQKEKIFARDYFTLLRGGKDKRWGSEEAVSRKAPAGTLKKGGHRWFLGMRGVRGRGEPGGEQDFGTGGPG